MEILETKEKLAALTFRPGRKFYYSDITMAEYIFANAFKDENFKNSESVNAAAKELGRWCYAIANVLAAGYVAGVREHKLKQKGKEGRNKGGRQLYERAQQATKKYLAKAAANMWPLITLENINTASYILYMADDEIKAGAACISRDSMAITGLFIAGRIAGARAQKRKEKAARRGNAERTLNV